MTQIVCCSWKTLTDCVFNLIANETFLTVTSGVLVFVIGQLFNEYWLKPIQKYKELRAKISYSLCYYANLYMNPVMKEYDKNGEWEEGSKKMRELSGEVRSMIELRPFGNVFIPRKKILGKVAENIMGISNGFIMLQEKHDYWRANSAYLNEIYSLLKIKNSR